MIWDVNEAEYLQREGPSELTGSSFYREIARGNVNGAEPFSAFGVRTTSGSETDHVIWPNGTFSIPDPAGIQMTVVSSSASDSSAGTNVRTIDIHYLDANLDPQVEVVTMNGLTGVTTTATNIRFIQCIHVVSFGTTATAAGTITVKSAGGTIYSQINAGEVRCSSSMRMVPNGKTAYIVGAAGSSVSGTAAARTTMYIITTWFTNQSFTNPLVLIPLASAGIQDAGLSFNFTVPLKVPSGNIVGMTHTTDKVATLSGSWFGWIENE